MTFVRQLRRLGLRVLIRWSHRETFHGIVVFAPDDEPDECREAVAKICRALELIRVYYPSRFARLQRDLPFITCVENSAIRGGYHEEFRMCELDSRWLRREATSLEEVAMVIAHEGTHARLQAHGVRYLSGRKLRIERVCAQAEIALARRLPGAARQAAAARRMQANAEVVWSDERLGELRRRANEELLEQLRQLGGPRWALAFMERFLARQTTIAGEAGSTSNRRT